MNPLFNELENIAKANGIDLFGIAELTSTQTNELVMQQGGKHIAKYPRAISLACRLLDAVVDELYRHEEPSAIYTYRGLYDSVNNTLDKAALLIAKTIQSKGHNAYPIPASQTINPRKLESAFSHKLAANLAGLGWIGKSCLLITPEYGPRIRLTTVLTDADLTAGNQTPNRCGSCRECVDACPPQALTGVPFDSSEPRDIRFRAHMCRDYTQRRAQQLGEGICGICVYSCPFGKS
jgi:epoxyqueuosine reductase QueG